MRTIFIVLLNIFISNFIISQEISFTNSEIAVGEIANIDLLLTNPEPVGGVQFHIIDLPNQGEFINVLPTERTSHFLINFIITKILKNSLHTTAALEMELLREE